MAKLFLSFLGTNNYEPCVYYQGEKPPLPERRAVRFVQEATIGRYCKEWGGGIESSFSQPIRPMRKTGSMAGTEIAYSKAVPLWKG